MHTITLFTLVATLRAPIGPDCAHPADVEYRGADTAVVTAVACGVVERGQTVRQAERAAAVVALTRAVDALPVKLVSNGFLVSQSTARTSSVAVFRFLDRESTSWILIARSERSQATMVGPAQSIEVTVSGVYRFVRDVPEKANALRVSVGRRTDAVRPWIAPDLPADPVEGVVTVSDTASVYLFTVEDDSVATLELPSCAAATARAISGSVTFTDLEGSLLYAPPGPSGAMAILVIAVRGRHPAPPVLRPARCFDNGRYLSPRPLPLTSLFTWYANLAPTERARAIALVPIRPIGGDLP